MQTTGPGKAIAFDAGYLKDFPKEVRSLVGATSGVLLAQQTAANLHARPGDTVSVKRVGLPPVDVKVDGVVELPDADALFQGVGLPPSASPQAPPDNVLILPPADWHRVFDPQTKARPDSTYLQFHVRLDHTSLPAAPTAAYKAVTGATHNLQARVAGKALVSDNLGSRLSAVREDALYARVLFLFLGLPGVFLAAALTLAATAVGTDRRRIEQALLRVRGASTRQILGLAGGEAVVVGVAGTALGIGAVVLGALATGAGAAVPGLGAVLLAVLLGLVLSCAAILVPAWIMARRPNVSAGRRSVSRVRPMAWERFYPDLVLLALSGLVFWQSASGGYQIVLAPEGVAATSVDYKAFIAPALFWAGAALLVLRLARLALRSRKRPSRQARRPLGGRARAGRLGDDVAAVAAHRDRHGDAGARRRLRRLDLDLQHDLQRASASRRGADERLGRDGLRHDRPSGRRASRRGSPPCPTPPPPFRCSTAMPMSAPTCRTCTASGLPASAARRHFRTPISPA